MLQPAPFSLYIHIPYCRAKCPYCDFNSFAAQEWPEERYTAALCAELNGYGVGPDWSGRRLTSVFFGGGTPSLFRPSSISRILATAFERWPARPDGAADGQAASAPPVEVTLEANPGTVDGKSLAALRAAGVNRLSLGVQSFLPRHLRALGRIHSPEEAVGAVHAARDAGYTNLSLDLMFALPGQTLEEWRSDLEQAVALHPEHLSVYNLTYEEGTAFHRQRSEGLLREQPEETELSMFTLGQELLRGAGYEHYEISNYARPGHACVHNLNYWQSGDYLGVGAGAHSYLRLDRGADNGGCRWSNLRGPEAYMAAVSARGQARVGVESLTDRQSRGEFVFLGLRCSRGFSEESFRERFGQSFTEAFPHAADLCAQGLLRHDQGHWQLSRHGLHLADTVFATFL